MTAPAELERTLLATERDRAERRLNGFRATILVLLSAAAAAYAPTLSRQLNAVNLVLLTPMLAWTILQYALWYRRDRLPSWLAIVNPIIDITALTLTMAGYGLAATTPLALKSPMVLAYFIILAARPMTSSVRKAVIVAILVVLAYGSLDLFFLLRHAIIVHDPVTASVGPGISLLDEGTKVFMLAMAGAVATYATWWHERLALQYAAAAHERELLQSRLAASQLDNLKQQLQPHFLFNALNAITALVSSDPPAAQQMISGLGELIRVSLDSTGEQVVPLRRELAVLNHYVSIQRTRFEDRLTVVMDADEAVQDALVPALILQPLVENSIKYGLGQRAAPAWIEVRAKRDGDALTLTVTDDGPGLNGKSVDTLVEHVGVGNARARLLYLYGDQHSFTIESPPGGGFVVRMRIPYRSEVPVSPALTSAAVA